jgi:dipeptidyl aminopeptidase/acylaminoacyl peptidase
LDVWRIRASGGEPQALTQHALDVGSIAPFDARTVLYTARAEDGSGPWLWALDVEARTSRRVDIGLQQYSSVSASNDGLSIVAAVASPRASLWVVPVLDRMAEPSDVKAYGPPGVRALAPRVSGKALFYLSALGTGDGLWRFQDGKSTEIWDGSRGAQLDPPAISPDGLRATVVLRKGGRHSLTVMDVDGGVPRSLTDAIDVRGTADWSPDGKWLVVGGKSKDGQSGLFKVSSDGGETIPLHHGHALNPAWSASEDLIAFSGDHTGGSSPLLMVRPDGQKVPMPDVLISAQTGPRFLADGSGIVFLEGRYGSELWLLDLKTKERRQLTRIAGDTTQGSIGAFDVTPDGRIIFDRRAENSDIVLIRRPR